jgi:predicted acylesterase/phospholipase RssA
VPVEGAALLGDDIVIAVYLEAGSVQKPRTVADVISRSFTIIQRHADVGWRQIADVIIEPEVKDFVWDDFTHWSDLIAAGEVAALRALPKIREALTETAEERAS